MVDTPLIIIIFSSAVLIAPFLAQTLFLPLAVVEILLGSLIGYWGILDTNAYIPIVAKTGFLFLMFLAGMEVNLKAFLTMKKSLFISAILYFTIMYSLSAFIVFFFHQPSIYLVAYPIVSLGMIMALIKELGKDEPWLELALIIGIFGEFVSIVALTFLSAVLEFGMTMDLIHVIGSLLLFLIGVVFLFRTFKLIFWWFPEIKKKLMPELDNRDKDVRISMAFFFSMVAMMIYLKLDMVLGAFIAGMFVVTFFEHKTELPHKLSSLGFGFLIPIFFIYVGSTVNLDALFSPDILLRSIQIVGIMFSLRLLSSTVYFKQLRFSNMLRFAMGDSMPLTFLLAVATIGKESNAIEESEYFALIIAGVIASVLFMTIIKVTAHLRKHSNVAIS